MEVTGKRVKRRAGRKEELEMRRAADIEIGSM